jgi:hypothetical protein
MRSCNDPLYVHAGSHGDATYNATVRVRVGRERRYDEYGAGECPRTATSHSRDCERVLGEAASDESLDAAARVRVARQRRNGTCCTFAHCMAAAPHHSHLLCPPIPNVACTYHVAQLKALITAEACALCITERASLRCSNCNLPVCHVHKSAYNQELKSGGRSATTFVTLQLCDTCRELYRITDMELEAGSTCTPTMVAAWFCCLTIILIPCSVNLKYKEKCRQNEARKIAATAAFRQYNMQVSPPKPIVVTRTTKGPRSYEAVWTGTIYPHDHPAFAGSTATSTGEGRYTQFPY